MSAPDGYVSLALVRHLTGLSERSLRRWCRTGIIRDAWQPAGYAGAWYAPVDELVRLGLMADSEAEHVTQGD